MSGKLNENLAKLLEGSVAIETSEGGKTLWITKLELETAIKIGYMLTVQLDVSQGERSPYRPDRYTLGAALSEARTRLAESDSLVFGETRPDDRNLAVRVEQDRQGFSLIADVRNDYEDLSPQ
jgi:hypothetical protein